MWGAFAAAAASGVVLLGALAAVDALSWTAAVVLAALWCIGLGVVGTGLLLRRIAVQTRRLHRRLERHARNSADAIFRDRVELVGRIADVANRVDATESTLDELRQRDLPKLGADVVQRVERRQDRRFVKLTEHVARQGRDDYEQQVAWQELREFVRPGSFMPALRGWAASPDVLRLVVDAIRARHPKLVVECGSGASSVWLGYALRRAGGGRLVALEHDERYADLTRRMLADHDLDDIVEIRHAPLRDWVPTDPDAPNPSGQPWYDLAAVCDLNDIDLLFVDGPPHFTATEARYPAGPALLPRCSASAVVVLDDTSRHDEQALSGRWLAATPGLVCDEVPVEKGARVFTWREH
ncbi:putative O-methyltransferase YrrM [Lipingzhangella halophila]|uniref:Putative O-methyltransferase YrrM n=1 Tax=Lipingzhangella halophila TaxID=1783352 RepID=A0A7W7W2K0_9ACTN|nr:class I SAM-dependent methyltransferase [Lipingzhangella halophila]MBB4930735.1 putative O-methyltransferase YrrM [Lipingzhangella halophila]